MTGGLFGLAGRCRPLLPGLVLIGGLAVLSAALVNALRSEPLTWDWRPPALESPVMDNSEALARILRERPGLILLDARHPALYKMGHIPGALSLPLESAEELIPDFAAGLPSQAEIIIYCSDPLCPMAGQLARLLAERGVAATVFRPGFETWSDEGRPVEPIR